MLLGLEKLRDVRSIAIPTDFDGPCLNKFGLQTRTAGTIILRVSTIMQQQKLRLIARQPPQPPAGGDMPSSEPRRQRAPFKAIKDAHSLGASETAADRVRRRLEERSRARQAGVQLISPTS